MSVKILKNVAECNISEAFAIKQKKAVKLLMTFCTYLTRNIRDETARKITNPTQYLC